VGNLGWQWQTHAARAHFCFRRRQTGQGRDNIILYLFSQMNQEGKFYEL